MDANERLLQAVRLATRRLASTGPIDGLLADVLLICVEAVGASGGTIYAHEPRQRRLVFRHVLPTEVREKLPSGSIPDDFGVAGRVFQTGITEISEFAEQRRDDPRAIEQATGVTVHTMITVPLRLADDSGIGVVQLINKRDGQFNEADTAVLETLAAVAAMAIVNKQLADESARASTLLGMGKVSHDIGNLAASLFANINYAKLEMAEVRTVRDAAEQAGKLDAIEETLDDLQTSLTRIVGYSRLLSDLSAGRPLRPTFRQGSLAQAILAATDYLEVSASKHRVALEVEVDRKAPPIQLDDLYIFRIVQNLVGNAIQAVRETIPDRWLIAHEDDEEATYGEVFVRHYRAEGQQILEVRDTGPGLDQEAVDQILAGNARTQWSKSGGSGWGIKIVLELAAVHRAEVILESEPGKGTTFRLVFPGSP